MIKTAAVQDGSGGGGGGNSMVHPHQYVRPSPTHLLPAPAPAPLKHAAHQLASPTPHIVYTHPTITAVPSRACDPLVDLPLAAPLLAKQEYLRATRMLVAQYMEMLQSHAGGVGVDPVHGSVPTDLYIYCYGYTGVPPPSGSVPNASGDSALWVPQQIWCPLRMQCQMHDSTHSINIRLRPDTDTFLGLPQILPDVTGKSGGMRFSFVSLSVIVACQGATVRAGDDTAGILLHGVFPEPSGRFEPDDTWCTSQFCNVTSDGVRVVMRAAGVAYRTSQPMTAMAMHELLLTMDTLFEVRHPPHWPFALATLQLTKRTTNPILSGICRNVVEAYERLRTQLLLLDSRVQSVNDLTRTIPNTPPYNNAMPYSSVSASARCDDVPSGAWTTKRSSYGEKPSGSCTIC